MIFFSIAKLNENVGVLFVAEQYDEIKSNGARRGGGNVKLKPNRKEKKKKQFVIFRHDVHHVLHSFTIARIFLFPFLLLILLDDK